MAKKQIGICVPEFRAAKRILPGIYRYARPLRPWDFTLFSAHAINKRMEQIIALPPHLALHGLIVWVNSEEMTGELRRLGMPVVNVNPEFHVEDWPLVCTDDREVGRLAAEHLIGRGYKHFGFLGYPEIWWSNLRKTGFKDVLKNYNVTPSCLELPLTGELEIFIGQAARNERIRVLSNWIEALPKPAVVYTAHDALGYKLSLFCRRLQLRIPDEIAIFSTDNDSAYCEAASPPFSSIELPSEEVGFQAAAILDQMMNGKPYSKRAYVKSIEVVARGEEADEKVTDPDVLSALRYIRFNLGKDLQVNDLLKVVNVSRRIFEVRFKQQIGRSPRQEILRIQLERAKDLLLNPNVPIHEVATRSGFGNSTRLEYTFHKTFKMTPSNWRLQNKSEAQ